MGGNNLDICVFVDLMSDTLDVYLFVVLLYLVDSVGGWD